MDRREAIRTLGTALAVPVVGTTPWDPTTISMLRSARSVMDATPTAFRTLTPRQVALVTSLTELVIPETETPGATSVGVTDFVDVMLTDWYTPDESAAFVAGLERIDVEARSSYGVDFVDADAASQGRMLDALDADLQESLLSEDSGSALDPVAAPTGASADGPDPSSHFMYRLKQLTLTGYFTSEPGMTLELDYQVIPGRYDGCADRG